MDIDYEYIATELIDAVIGLQTKDHVEGVIHVLKQFEKAINEQWDKHLCRDTNECLFMEHVVCNVCESPIQIWRTGNGIHVEQEEGIS